MAEPNKDRSQELYKAVLDFYENDDRNDAEFKEDFPNLFAIVNSGNACQVALAVYNLQLLHHLDRDVF